MEPRLAHPALGAVLLACLAVASATVAESLQATLPAECAGPAPLALNADFEARVVVLVNEQRAAAGLPPLERAEALFGSARWFARRMATHDYFGTDHDTYARLGGALVRVCRWQARIGAFYPGWRALAETTAAGHETPEEVVRGWLASPGHRKKLLSPGRWQAGAGYWTGGREGHYWVLDLGRRAESLSR